MKPLVQTFVCKVAASNFTIKPRSSRRVHRTVPESVLDKESHAIRAGQYAQLLQKLWVIESRWAAVKFRRLRFREHGESEHFQRLVLDGAVPLLEARDRSFYDPVA